MDALVELGRGPLFRFTVTVAVLGLARHVALSAWALREARRRGGNGRFPVGPVLARTLRALSPARFLVGTRGGYTALSVLFHLGVILVPVFYLGHVKLWRAGLGVGWPALPPAVASGLTLLTVATGALLVIGRAANHASRTLSRLQDWALPVLIVVEFSCGWLLAHPGALPFAPRGVLLAHVLVGDLLLFLTPFTKIAHCALLPFSQLVYEAAWRFVPGAGREVTRTLGKEGQPI
jgi:hypothetical protein